MFNFPAMLPSTTDDIILDNLSYADIFRYSKTCKDAHHTVSSYIQRKHRLENVLGRYFTDDQILHFRHLQATTGMIISGSAALQFFERVIYPESDLDLYVDHRYRRPIALWLASIGYRYVPYTRMPDAADRVSSTQPTLEEALAAVVRPIPEHAIFYNLHPNIAFRTLCNEGYADAVSILNFEKRDKYQERCKIQIISSPHSPVEMVLNYHSSCVMNFITHDKAYSLYPRATFEKHRSLVFLRGTAARDKALAKYTERGWSALNSITEADFYDLNSGFVGGPRFVGDSKTWTIPILPKIDTPSQDGLVEMNSFLLRHDISLKPHLEFFSLISPQLRYRYLVCDEDLPEEIQNVLIDYEQTRLEAEQPYDGFLKSVITPHFKEAIDRQWLPSSIPSKNVSSDIVDTCNFHAVNEVKV